MGWAIYKHMASVSPNVATIELYLACDGALQSAILVANLPFTTLTEPALTTLINLLAVLVCMYACVWHPIVPVSY